jgi:hypothetical protein
VYVLPRAPGPESAPFRPAIRLIPSEAAGSLSALKMAPSRGRGVGVDLFPAVLPSASLGPGDEALLVLFWPYESLVV